MKRALLFVFIGLSCLFGGSVLAQQPATSGDQRDEKLWRKALEIQRKAIVVDTHNDVLSFMTDDNYDIGVSSVGKYHTDIARMKQGGLTAEFFSVYIDRSYAKDGGSARRALDMIDYVYRAVEKYPNEFTMSFSVADIRRAKKQKKIAALMGIEGGHAIEDSLMALRDFYRLGVRYMTLTHNNTNNWADACCDTATHNGLSDFGKDVVREMNRIGMLIDVSHVSDKTMHDVFDVSTAPVIASHSSARALGERPRNIPDDLLRRFTKNGGVVMINFYPGFIDSKVIAATAERTARLKPQMDELKERHKADAKKLEEETNKLLAANPLPATPLSVLIDHFDHVAKVAGVDHVGIGSDFDGIGSLPIGMEDISKLPNLTYELLKRGYSESDVRKILGENFLRAFAEAERVSKSSGTTLSAGGSVRRIPEKAKVSSNRIKTDEQYRARVKDLIEFHLEGVADECCLEVDERGMIQVPFMEAKVNAAGKTANELTAELVTHFKRHLRRPRVQVRVYTPATDQAGRSRR